MSCPSRDLARVRARPRAGARPRPRAGARVRVRVHRATAHARAALVDVDAQVGPECPERIARKGTADAGADDGDTRVRRGGLARQAEAHMCESSMHV
jgi:hypothetical protein